MKRPDLHTAVDALVLPTRVRVWRENTKRTETKTIPSLWAQLEDSANWQGGGSGGAGAFGSRPTISTGVVSLLIEVSDAAAWNALDLAGKTFGSVPANLREIATKLTAGSDVARVDWWNTALRNWVRQARTELRLDPVRPKFARGIACPECGETTATSTQDGETVRTPAMAITWTGPGDDEHHPDTDWKVRAVECRCCLHTWWRGESLDGLVEQMLIANQTRETLAE